MTVEELEDPQLQQEWRDFLKKGGKIEGLGDVISKTTKALGIKECGGCTQRREWLNKLFPFNAS